VTIAVVVARRLPLPARIMEWMWIIILDDAVHGAR
jgi:hypothetical protein